MPRISEANVNDEKSYNLSVGTGSQEEIRDQENELSVTHSEIQNSMSLLQRKIQFLENKLASNSTLLDGGIREADSEVEETLNAQRENEGQTSRAQDEQSSSPTDPSAELNDEPVKDNNKLGPVSQARAAASALACNTKDKTNAIEDPNFPAVNQTAAYNPAQDHHELSVNDADTGKSLDAESSALKLAGKRPSDNLLYGGHYVSNSQDSNNKDTLPLQTVERIRGLGDDQIEHPEPVSFRTS